MRARINQSIKVKTDGIDWAAFAAYTGACDLALIDGALEKKVMTKNIEFSLANSTTESTLKILATDLKISKSEVVRRCFTWLETQQNYPKNFIK